MKKHILLLILSTLVGQFLLGQNLRYGLVFYAPFDGNTINLVDWVTPRNQGATLVPNKFGEAHRAIAFDGESALLDYGNILNLGQGQFTISCWVSVDEFTPGFTHGEAPMLMNKGLTGNDPSGLRGFGIRAVNFEDSGNNLRMMTADGQADGAAPKLQFTDKSGLEVETWYHLILTREGRSLRIYINGEQVLTTYAPHTFDLSTDQPFTLGGVLENSDYPARNHFKGKLDELRIYNRCLHQRDIDALYFEFMGEEEEEIRIPSPPVRKRTINLSTYPNPATTLLNVDFTTTADRRLEVVDEAGRSLAVLRSTEQKAQINVAGYPPGIYFLKVREEDIMVVRKFIKVGTVLP